MGEEISYGAHVAHLQLGDMVWSLFEYLVPR
jgi:hypothetical protein